MRKIAIYGKGGIGKSTITSSISAAIAGQGYKVMQIGCDPKADSTLNLRGGKELTPVMEVLQKSGGVCKNLDEIAIKGYCGIVCVEAGGPTPGSGCAGRGIIKTFDTLDYLDAFKIFDPDYVFFDVLGDVVCGGFAVPIRQGYADEVVIVTSGEKMALYAASNIKAALDNFKERNYAKLRGIILNRRNITDEIEIVQEFADRIGTEIIGIIPRDNSIQSAEEKNMTVIQMDGELPVSKTIKAVARKVMEAPACEITGGE
ncbi:MAG: nitrogenase iron protein NifH [Clostridiaceae bacterium]|jgi:nitrogenase iron protein NifH|nr:nitrogenase iron protein NifH [Clostridiaceae bacterium]